MTQHLSETPVAISEHMTPTMVERIMGVAEGAIGTVAWVAIRAEAEGVSRAEVAAGLGCEIDDLAALVRMVAGGAGQEEAERVWAMGVVALRTSGMLNNQGINSGWDSLEALALKHLNAAMAKVKIADPEKMLRIAVAANAAKRRARGEGMSGTRIGIAAGVGGVTVDVGTSLRGGDVGVMRLNLSPAIREQMGDAGRVIEGRARGKEERVEGNAVQRLEMLRIGDVRELAGDKPADESKGMKNAVRQDMVKDVMGDYFAGLGDPVDSSEDTEK